MPQRPTYDVVRIEQQIVLPAFDATDDVPTEFHEEGATVFIRGGSGDPVGKYTWDATESDWNRDVRPADEVRALSGNMATNGLVYDNVNDEVGFDIVATGPETLSDGEFEIDLGEAVTNGRQYCIFYGDTDGADVAAEKGETAGNHAITIVETDTSIGTPTVDFTVIRI